MWRMGTHFRVPIFYAYLQYLPATDRTIAVVVLAGMVAAEIPHTNRIARQFSPFDFSNERIPPSPNIPSRTGIITDRSNADGGAGIA